MENQIHCSLLLHSCRPITVAADANSLLLLQTLLFVGALGKMFENVNSIPEDPIQRLTPHDFQQPGAILAVVILVLVILIVTAF